MTARALLNFVAEIRGMSKPERKRRIEEVIDQVHLEEVIFRPIETLSKGFKRRVGLAQAILHDPELLILDEPTDGLDPNQKHEVRTLLQKMAPDKAIVISTHILEEVDAVCTRALIIAHGKLLADGTPEELRAQSTTPNSLSVRVAVAQAEQVRGKLRAMAGVGFVEIVGKVEGVAHLTVAPDGDEDILARVAELVRAEDAGAEQIVAIPGSLDDVFREITQGQGGRSRMRNTLIVTKAGAGRLFLDAGRVCLSGDLPGGDRGVHVLPGGLLLALAGGPAALLHLPPLALSCS